VSTLDSNLSDLRFRVPLYTLAQAAQALDVPPSTLNTWARGYVRRPPGRRVTKQGPVITATAGEGKRPIIPFIGLAEGLVVAAFRRAGVSMQHIRKAVRILEREIRLDHALASERLYTDGARILFDAAGRSRDRDIKHLLEVLSGQGVFAPVIQEYLQRITYAPDGWAARLVLPITTRNVVEVDPERSFGQPIFIKGAVRVEDVIDRWKAGESLTEVAADFGVPPDDVEDVLRAGYPEAA
jgi:uncharacterized protein (DUF433 family)